jgi:hypothetical protein
MSISRGTAGRLFAFSDSSTAQLKATYTFPDRFLYISGMANIILFTLFNRLPPFTNSRSIYDSPTNRLIRFFDVLACNQFCIALPIYIKHGEFPFCL